MNTLQGYSDGIMVIPMNEQRYRREIMNEGNRQFTFNKIRSVTSNGRISGFTYFRNAPCNRVSLTGGSVIFKFGENMDQSKKQIFVDQQGQVAMPPGSVGKRYRVIIFKETNTAMCKPSRY